MCYRVRRWVTFEIMRKEISLWVKNKTPSERGMTLFRFGNLGKEVDNFFKVEVWGSTYCFEKYANCFHCADVSLLFETVSKKFLCWTWNCGDVRAVSKLSTKEIDCACLEELSRYNPTWHREYHLEIDRLFWNFVCKSYTGQPNVWNVESFVEILRWEKSSRGVSLVEVTGKWFITLLQ